MSESILNLSTQEEAEAATRALIALAEAAERATAALDGLDFAGHGGVTIKAVGDVAHIEIAPSTGHVGTIIDDLKSGGLLSQAMDRTYGLNRRGA